MAARALTLEEVEAVSLPSKGGTSLAGNDAEERRTILDESRDLGGVGVFNTGMEEELCAALDAAEEAWCRTRSDWL